MGDDLENKRQLLLAKQMQLSRRAAYEEQMQYADDFAHSNGHMTNVRLLLAQVTQELADVAENIRRRK